MFRQIQPVFLALLLAVVSTCQAQVPDDFTLHSVTDDSRFVLSQVRGSYVALHFLLKTECPVCIRHTWDYSGKSARLPEVVQVFIKPDSEEDILEWTKNLPEDGLLNFPIYRDPEATLAGQFEIPDGYHFHGQLVHYPALILLNPDGKEIYRYIGRDNRDRYSFEQLEEKLMEISGE